MNAINPTSYYMRLCSLLLCFLMLGCTVNLEVEELPKVEVEHKLTLPESADGTIPHQCDNLANLEMSKFFEAGLCDKYQVEHYDCCAFKYNSSCTVSFCTMIKENYEKYCTVISDGCEF